MLRIGLMGGSFNPVHEGHLHLARAALESGCVDKVFFLPTGNPPHKSDGLANQFDRLRMVELAVQGEEKMEVCREEIDRDGIIYTVDTLRRLLQKHRGQRFVYLIGADTLRTLYTWRCVEEVITLCDFLVLMRPGEQREQMQRLMQAWRTRGAHITALTAEPMDISSTQIRNRISAGQTIDTLVPKAVADYIRERALYGNEVEMKREKIVYKLKKALDAQRFAHTLGVEETAREMARCFGEDEERAALAGLLHDCAKCLTLGQMVKAAKEVKLDPVMKESKALMHAVAGACMAKNIYGVEDEAVLSCIRWHTTGRSGMTRLEKIIYLADMIEPNRKPFDGLEELRALCREDLDKAMHRALLMSFEHVQRQGKTLHPDTLAALEDYEPVSEIQNMTAIEK